MHEKVMKGGCEEIDSQRKALMAARAALEKHAEDVIVMDVSQLSGVTDYFVVGTATSRRQLAAIAEEIERALREQGHRTLHVEGLETDAKIIRRARRKAKLAKEPWVKPFQGLNGNTWVLMDCGELVVHLFDPDARDYYQLERLWGDAPRIPVEPAPRPSIGTRGRSAS